MTDIVLAARERAYAVHDYGAEEGGNMTREAIRCVAVGVVLLVTVGSAPGAPLGTGFTYQGQLQQSSLPTDGVCDFQFSLWDAAGSGQPPAGGNQIGSTQTVAPATVTAGLFTVALNDAGQFGASAFSGDDRWLQIGVRCPAGGGSYITLGPRQKLTAAPYALYASSAATAADLSCTGCVSSNDLANGAITSGKIAGGTIQQSNLAFTPGTVTSITAGTGLTGGTITTSGTIAVDFGKTSATVACQGVVALLRHGSPRRSARGPNAAGSLAGCGA